MSDLGVGMPKLSEEAMEDRRQQIISAARRVFAEKGLSKVTLREVFKESGLSAGAVYNYFKTKDDLILAVAESGMAEVLGGFSRAGIKSVDLHIIIAGFIMMLANMDPSQAPKVDVMIAAEALANEEIRETVCRSRAMVKSALIAVIEARQERDESWRGFPASTLAELLYATYQGLIVSVALGEKPDVNGVGAALQKIRFA